MTDAHTQQLAKRCLESLEELVLLGRLDSYQLSGIRPHLDALARPPPPPVVGRKPPPVPSSNASLPQCKAIWSYAGAEEDELTFHENDTIEIVEEVDAAWWRGRVVHANGSRTQDGLFPSNYVEKTAASSAVVSPSLPPRNMPPVYTPSIASSEHHAPSTYSLASSNMKHNEDPNNSSANSRVSMPTPYGSSDEKSSLGPAPWRPGVARWSSGAPPPPPPPPHTTGGAPLSPTGSNQSYYSSSQHNSQQHNTQQQDMQTAGQAPGNPALYGTQQPVVNDPSKNDKMKKFGGRMGQTLATSFVGGVGFGVGSHLF